MIELHIEHLQKNHPALTPHTEKLLVNLNRALEKQNFYGKILLSYEAGELQHIKSEQNFTVDSLTNYLKI